jgi:predicted nuclease of predicted toxin-antitoxin system
MKFLIDAQLPKRLAYLLKEAGHDTLHTRDLPSSNRTPDAEINRISIQENRIVVTKDADFQQSFLLQQHPYKLLLVTTGNIPNPDLEALFLENIAQLVQLFEQNSYIEINRDSVTVHM